MNLASIRLSCLLVSKNYPTPGSLSRPLLLRLGSSPPNLGSLTPVSSTRHRQLSSTTVLFLYKAPKKPEMKIFVSVFFFKVFEEKKIKLLIILEVFINFYLRGKT